jgi:predicted HTH transcriptional regulator
VGVKGNYYDISKDIDFTGWLEYFAEGILDELYRVTKELDASVIGPAITLKEYHKAILSHIGNNGFITDREYARLTDRARPTRAIDFNKLIELGYIERFGKGRGSYYKLKK